MTDRRIPARRERRQSRARYRCPECRRWTVATEYGVCPRCGLGPPSPVPPAGPVDPEAWSQARREARALGSRHLAEPSGARFGVAYWVSAVAFALGVGLAAALFVVC